MFTKVLLILHTINYVQMQLYQPIVQIIQVPEDPPVQQPKGDFVLGSCKIAIDRKCPDLDVGFYLYTRRNPEYPEFLRISADEHVSNLNQTAFDPRLSTKIIVHGYNSDMNLPVLVEIRKQYLINRPINVITVDWSPLAQGPCYPAAVWNIKHVGQCTSQLVERIVETGATDIHVLGFSLGAHVLNYVAINLRPYKIPRITGLDPAMPGFIAVSDDSRLDKSDAIFVDILHTNAFMQGTFLESGHVDFFLNGGVIQPGCWAENRFFACNHHRAPLYFAESINTKIGFWGWPCPSYTEYFFNRCPPKDPQIIMGEHVNRNSSGIYLVITESVSPFAVGKYDGPIIEIFVKSFEKRVSILEKYKEEFLEFMDEDDLLNNINYNMYEIKNSPDYIFL